MPWRHDAGVDDDDVEPAEGRDRGGDGGRDVFFMADVGDPAGEARRQVGLGENGVPVEDDLSPFADGRVLA